VVGAEQKARAVFKSVPAKARHPVVSGMTSNVLYWLLDNHEKATSSTALADEIITDAWKEWGKRDDGRYMELLIRFVASQNPSMVLRLPLTDLIRQSDKPFAQKEMVALATALLRKDHNASSVSWSKIAALCYDLLKTTFEGAKKREKFQVPVLQCMLAALRKSSSIQSLPDVARIEKLRDACPKKKGPIYNMSQEVISLAKSLVTNDDASTTDTVDKDVIREQEITVDIEKRKDCTKPHRRKRSSNLDKKIAGIQDENSKKQRVV